MTVSDAAWRAMQALKLATNDDLAFGAWHHYLSHPSQLRVHWGDDIPPELRDHPALSIH